MLGWAGLVLLLLAMLSFLLLDNPGESFGLRDDQFGELVYFGALLAALGGGLLVQYRGRFSDAVRHIAMWLGIALAVLIFYTYKSTFEAMAWRVAGTLVPSIEVRGESVRLNADANGQFSTTVRVNGKPVYMLVDTGATDVVLSYQDAEMLGIDVSSLHFSVTVDTANGSTKAAHFKLNTIEVGALRANNVSTLISQRGRLRQSLLGMSFIRRVGGFELRGDQLVLKPRELAH